MTTPVFAALVAVAAIIAVVGLGLLADLIAHRLDTIRRQARLAAKLARLHREDT